MRNYIFFFTLLIGLIRPSYAQQSNIDSLKQIIANQDSDSVKVQLLIKLSGQLSNEESAQGRLFILQALTISQNNNYQKGIADANLNLAFNLINNYEYGNAEKKIAIAKSIYESIGDIKGISRTLNALASVCIGSHSDYDSAFVLYNISKGLCDSIKYDRGKASVDYSLGYLHLNKGNNKLALEHFNMSLEYYKGNNQADSYWDIWSAIGIVYDGMGFYDDALDYYLKALEVALVSEKHQSNLISLYNNIAIVYDNTKNNKKALEYYMKAFEIVQNIGDKEWEALLYNNLVYIKLNEGDTTTALEYIWSSINIYHNLKIPCTLSYPYEGIGSIYLNQNKLDSAYYYFKAAESIAIECKDNFVLSTLYRDIGKIHQKRKQYRQTLKYFDKSREVSLQMGLRNELSQIYHELSSYFEQRQDYVKSLDYLKLYQTIRDSIYNNESADKIAKLTSDYAFKKEKKLIELENEKQSLKLTAKIEKEEQNRNTILIVLILSIILIGTLLRGYFFISNRNKKLTLLNEEKNTLIGVVAHDLRSPLNNMKALVPIIRNSANQKKQIDLEHYLSLFDKSTLRMSDMINRILDINAIESQKISLRLEKSDITEIFDNSINSFEIAIAKKELRVFKNFELQNKHQANIDKNYLTQVFENIISNAVKFTEPGKGLFFAIKSQDGNVIISVKDEGQGISAEDLKNLFVKYQKLTAIPTANESSTGLGLSNAKKYVEAMNGEIWCESKLGHGSTFFISFKSTQNSGQELNSLFSI